MTLNTKWFQFWKFDLYLRNEEKFLAELHRYFIYDINSSNREPVHIDLQTNKTYGASETDLNIDYDIFNSFGLEYGNTNVKTQ